MKATALIFDMDGTLIDSSGVIDGIWRRWAASHDIDSADLLCYAHGRRAIETVQRFAPAGVDPIVEADELNRQAARETNGIIAVDGAKALLRQLEGHEWAIVTSALRPLATRWLNAAGLPLATTMICAEDVAQSKPAPEGYLLAAQRLGCASSDAIVFEDAEAGLMAGRAAGATVVGVGRSRHLAHLADNWIRDFTDLTVKREADSRLWLESRHKL